MAKDVAMLKALQDKINHLMMDVDSIKDHVGLGDDSVSDGDADDAADSDAKMQINAKSKQDDDDQKASDLAPAVKDKGDAMQPEAPAGPLMAGEDAAPKMPLQVGADAAASKHMGPMKKAHAALHSKY